MSTTTLLSSLFHYKSQANKDLLAALEALNVPEQTDSLHAALRVLNHVYVVDRIFRAHLCNEAREYTATNTLETPTLSALSKAVLDNDMWFVDYVSALQANDLEKPRSFVFTDGNHGLMSCEEILLHLITHGAYHRGAVGRILDQQSAYRPPDGLTNYLHAAEPERRVPQ